MSPGIAYAALAFVLWGVAPLYFKQIASVDAFEIVLHRSLWAMLFLLGVLAATRRWAWWGQALRQPRLLAVTALSALLLSGNWTLFVWSVNNGHVIDASLGYFINPLIYVLLGFVVLRERLRPLQWAAVGIAGLGVAWLTWLAGHPPWIALTLAFSFGLYGLLRKLAPLGALEGLALETLLMTLVALPLLALWTYQGRSALAHADAALIGWLMAAGPVTAVPLLLFGAGARRLSLATLGLLQYIGPTISLGLGIWLFHEPFDAARLAGFALIWLALALYSAEGVRIARRQAREHAQEEADDTARDAATQGARPTRAA